VDQELVEYLDRRFNQFRDEVLQDLRTELRHGLRARPRPAGTSTASPSN
jgi:hypothetical protein